MCVCLATLPRCPHLLLKARQPLGVPRVLVHIAHVDAADACNHMHASDRRDGAGHRHDICKACRNDRDAALWRLAGNSIAGRRHFILARRGVCVCVSLV